MPSAMSRPKEPVETTSTSVAASREPSFMIEPLPKARSICPRAASKARCLSIESLSKRRNAVCMIPLPPLCHTGPGRATRGGMGLYMICSQLQRPKSPVARNRRRGSLSDAGLADAAFDGGDDFARAQRLHQGFVTVRLAAGHHKEIAAHQERIGTLLSRRIEDLRAVAIGEPPVRHHA